MLWRDHALWDLCLIKIYIDLLLFSLSVRSRKMVPVIIVCGSISMRIGTWSLEKLLGFFYCSRTLKGSSLLCCPTMVFSPSFPCHNVTQFPNLPSQLQTWTILHPLLLWFPPSNIGFNPYLLISECRALAEFLHTRVFLKKNSRLFIIFSFYGVTTTDGAI